MELSFFTQVVMSKSRCAKASPAMELKNPAASWTPLALAVPRQGCTIQRKTPGIVYYTYLYYIMY